jgi:hypothetical protein
MSSFKFSRNVENLDSVGSASFLADILSKILEIMTFTMMTRKKKLETSDFPTCAKLKGRIGIRIWIGIKMESGIRIGLSD